MDRPDEVKDMPATRSDQVPVDDNARDLDGLSGASEVEQNLGFDDAMAFLDREVPGATKQNSDASAEDAPSGDAPAEESADPDDGPILSAEDMGLHEPDDTEEEPEPAAETADTGAEADTAEPDDADTDTETATTGDLDAFVEQVNSKFEDIGAESADDVVKELERERASNDIIVDVLDAHPQVHRFFEAVIHANAQGDSVDVDRLAQDHFQTNLPDPSEDPEGYAEAVRERERRNAMRETQAERRTNQLEQVEQQMEKMRKTAQESIEQVADEYGLEGQRLKNFRKQVASFVNQPDRDFAKVLYQGMHFEQLVERAHEKGIQKGRQESANARQERRKKGNAIPKLSSSRTGSDSPSSEGNEGQESLTDFAQSLQRGGGTLAKLANLS